jgi:hypothetical protein
MFNQQYPTIIDFASKKYRSPKSMAEFPIESEKEPSFWFLEDIGTVFHSISRCPTAPTVHPEWHH